MKILVICQHYWPEPYPLPDLCEELVRRGHTVDVVTDVPNYPMGVTYPGYRRGARRREVHNGVHITRTFTIARRHNAVFRLLNYYSYAWSSSLYARRLPGGYDVVFANQTSPVMMASAAFAYARRHGVKVVLYCMDLWPACLAAGGVGERSPIYRFFGRQARRLYNLPDRVLITSQMFRDYLVTQHGVDDAKIAYLPQYAAAQFDALPPADPGKPTVDLMFAGNVGAAQDLTTVLRAAELLRGEARLHWHIVGDGSELARLQALAAQKQLDCVHFHGRQPPEAMPRYYAMADAMLVTLTADRFISLTLPGKVQSYMAAGKPILAAADGEIPRVIGAAQCGWCAPAGDAAALADAVRQFLRCPDKAQLGRSARAYYEAHFTRQRFMDALERELAACARQAGPDAAQKGGLP